MNNFLSPVTSRFCSCYLFEITDSIVLSAFHCCSRYRLGEIMRRCCVNPTGLVIHFPPFLCYLTRPKCVSISGPPVSFHHAAADTTLRLPSPDAANSSASSFWSVALPLPVLTAMIYLCPPPLSPFLWVIPDATPVLPPTLCPVVVFLSAIFLRLPEIRCNNPFSPSCPSPCSSHRNGHKLGGGPDHTASHQPVTLL